MQSCAACTQLLLSAEGTLKRSASFAKSSSLQCSYTSKSVLSRISGVGLRVEPDGPRLSFEASALTPALHRNPRVPSCHHGSPLSLRQCSSWRLQASYLHPCPREMWRCDARCRVHLSLAAAHLCPPSAHRREPPPPPRIQTACSIIQQPFPGPPLSEGPANLQWCRRFHGRRGRTSDGEQLVAVHRQ